MLFQVCFTSCELRFGILLIVHLIIATFSGFFLFVCRIIMVYFFAYAYFPSCKCAAIFLCTSNVEFFGECFYLSAMVAF